MLLTGLHSHWARLELFVIRGPIGALIYVPSYALRCRQRRRSLPLSHTAICKIRQQLQRRRGGERDGRFAIENGLTAIMCERAIIAPAYSTPEARLSRNNDCRHNDCSNNDFFARRIRAPTVGGRSRCLSAFRLSSRGLTTRLHTAHPYEVLNKEAYCWRTPP